MHATPLYRDIGRRVGALRHKRELTREQLSAASGVDYSYLTRIESGKARPTLDTLTKVATALEVDLWEFFTDCRLKPDEALWQQNQQRLAQLLPALTQEDMNLLIALVERWTELLRNLPPLPR